MQIFSNANEFARIRLHFMLDPVQPLEYETGLLSLALKNLTFETQPSPTSRSVPYCLSKLRLLNLLTVNGWSRGEH